MPHSRPQRALNLALAVFAVHPSLWPVRQGFSRLGSLAAPTVAVLTLAVCACQAIRPTSDPDFWWHLQGGKETARRGWPPTQDRYTLLSAGRPWVYDSWLSGLSFYGLYTMGGLGAVSLAMAGVYTLALGAGILRCCRRGAGLPASCLATLLACWVLESQLRLAPRPFLFALLWANLALIQLDRWRTAHEGDSASGATLRTPLWRSPLAALVPIAILWVNGHASWPMLFVLLAVYGIDASVKRLGSSGGRLTHAGRAGNLKQWLLLSGFAGAALLINPYGPALLRAPYQILFATRWLNTAAEWQPAGLAPAFVPFLVYAALAAVALIARYRESWPADWMLFFLLGGMTLISYRHVLFFVPAMLPACALVLDRATAALGRGLQRLRWRASRAGGEWAQAPQQEAHVPLEAAANDRIPSGATITLPLCSMALLAAALHLHAAALPRVGIREASFPVKATAFLQTHAVSGPLFQQPDWAGYLLWHLYPQCRVYLDSRFTVHSEEAHTRYFATYCGLPGWPEKLQRDGVTAIVIAGPDRSGIGRRLVSTEGWVTVYWDDQAVVLVRPTERTRALVAQEDWSLSNPYFLEQRIASAGVREELEQQLAQKVRRDPGCGTAWFYLGRIRLEKKQLRAAQQAFTRSATRPSPYRHHARLFLAATLLRQGHPEQATQQLTRLWPARWALPPDAQRVVVELLTETGQPRKALQLQRELNQRAVREPSPYRRDLQQAREQFAAGQLGSARTLLRGLTGHAEIAAEVHLELGLLIAAQGGPQSEIDYHFARALTFRPMPELAERIREQYRQLRKRPL